MMCVVFVLLIPTLVMGSDEPQCVLSELEQNIKDYDSQFTFFPTLKKLRKVYPGDTFNDVSESACEDLISYKYCKPAAEQGCCNGTNHRVGYKTTQIFPTNKV